MCLIHLFPHVFIIIQSSAGHVTAAINNNSKLNLSTSLRLKRKLIANASFFYIILLLSLLVSAMLSLTSSTYILYLNVYKHNSSTISQITFPMLFISLRSILKFETEKLLSYRYYPIP